MWMQHKPRKYFISEQQINYHLYEGEQGMLRVFLNMVDFNGVRRMTRLNKDCTDF